MTTISLNWFNTKKIDSKSIHSSTMKVVDKQQSSSDLSKDITRSRDFWQMAEIS